MPDPALLDPNNRLLGWSTTDFSLYGGQPTVTLGMPRAEEAGGAFVSVPSAPAPAPASPGTGIGIVSDPDLATAQPIPADTGGTSGNPASVAGSLPAPLAPSLPSSPEAGAAVPAPTGSGSLAPISVASPLTEYEAGAGTPLSAGSPFATPTLDLAPVPPAPGGLAMTGLAPGLTAPVIDLVDTGSATVATALGAVDATLDSASTLLDGLATPLPLDTIAATLTPVAGTVAALGDTVGTTTAGIADTTETLTQTVGDTADAAIQTVGDTVGSATDATGDVLGHTTGTVASITDDAGTLALDAGDAVLGGTDPAGGVATLVGLVESADLFDLSTAGGAPAAITEGGSILDALAADEAPDALLGVTGEATEGLLGDHHDDHGGGLLGAL